MKNACVLTGLLIWAVFAAAPALAVSEQDAAGIEAKKARQAADHQKNLGRMEQESAKIEEEIQHLSKKQEAADASDKLYLGKKIGFLNNQRELLIQERAALATGNIEGAKAAGAKRCESGESWWHGGEYAAKTEALRLRYKDSGDGPASAEIATGIKELEKISQDLERKYGERRAVDNELKLLKKQFSDKAQELSKLSCESKNKQKHGDKAVNKPAQK